MAGKGAKERIVQALVSLMKRKPLDQVTVKELVRAAGVNRSTYYYHFYQVEDVLEYMMESFLENTRTITTYEQGYAWDADEGVRPRNVSNEFFGHIYRNRDLFEAIVSSPYKQRFYESLIGIFVEQYRRYPHWWRPEGELERMRMRERGYWDRCWSYLAIGAVEQWRSRDYEETPEELAKLVWWLFSNVNGFELRVEWGS